MKKKNYRAKYMMMSTTAADMYINLHCEKKETILSIYTYILIAERDWVICVINHVKCTRSLQQNKRACLKGTCYGNVHLFLN